MTRRQRQLLVAAFVLVGFLTVSSAVRGLNHARRLRADSNEPIQPWMNIGYIAHSYHVPPQIIHEALGLPLRPRDRRPLWRIAQAQGRSTDVLIEEITAAIQEARAPTPPEPPSAPDPSSSP